MEKLVPILRALRLRAVEDEKEELLAAKRKRIVYMECIENGYDCIVLSMILFLFIYLFIFEFCLMECLFGKFIL